MKHLLLAAILLAGLASPVFAQDETAAPETVAAPEPEERGASIIIDLDDGDSDSAKEKEIEERIEGKIENFVEGLVGDSDDEMTPEERKEFIEDMKELKKLGNEMHGDADADAVPLGGILVGGLAILLIFGTPVMIVAGVLYASYRKRRLIHDTINSYVASGKEIPPEVLKSFHEEAAPRRSNLNKGLVMVGIGLGIIVCFMAIGVEQAAALGAIPLFIGLAQLLIWKLENKDGKGSAAGN